MAIWGLYYVLHRSHLVKLSLPDILCFRVPSTSQGGKGPLHLSHLPPSLFHLTPSHSPHSLLLPSLPLAPLAPSHSPLMPNGQSRVLVCYTMCRGPHHLWGGKGVNCINPTSVCSLGVQGASCEQGEEALGQQRLSASHNLAPWGSLCPWDVPGASWSLGNFWKP